MESDFCNNATQYGWAAAFLKKTSDRHDVDRPAFLP